MGLGRVKHGGVSDEARLLGACLVISLITSNQLLLLTSPSLCTRTPDVRMDEEREASNRFLVSEAQLLAEKACMVVPLTRSLTDQAAREDARNQNASRPSETPLSCRGRLLRLRSRKILRGWERVQVL